MKRAYRRALCKLSGEAFSSSGFGFREADIHGVAQSLSLAHASGKELGIVVGAGNILRGKDSDLNYPPTVLDEVGMLATVLNGKLLLAALRKLGTPATLFNAFPCGNFAETFSMEKVENCLQKGEIVLFSGGTAHPFFTTDMAAALRALQMKADVLIKLSTVDAVYSEDPKISPNASKQAKITYREILEKKLQIMDLEAVLLCEREKLPIIVTHFSEPKNLTQALSCAPTGTLITQE
ncbi:MAG: UMP kinase [Chlamydiota bacterium]